MSVYIQPQRTPEEGDIVSDVRFAHRQATWIFITYDFIITPEYAGYFEWWFPYVDFSGRDVRIWHATLDKSNLVTAPQEVRLYMQSPSEEVRLLLYEFKWQAGKESIFPSEYQLPDGSRGVLVFDSIQNGTILRADYLIEVL